MFRGRRGYLVKILWHDGTGLSLYAKRLDRGRLVWPSRNPLSPYLLRERVVIPAPASRPCGGSDRLSKLGEGVTETLEVVPRQW